MAKPTLADKLVVAISSRALFDFEAPEEIVDAPDSAFLGKPFSPHELVAKVREVLEPVTS